jgi:hypothetical protein
VHGRRELQRRIRSDEHVSGSPAVDGPASVYRVTLGAVARPGTCDSRPLSRRPPGPPGQGRTGEGLAAEAPGGQPPARPRRQPSPVVRAGGPEGFLLGRPGLHLEPPQGHPGIQSGGHVPVPVRAPAPAARHDSPATGRGLRGDRLEGRLPPHQQPRRRRRRRREGEALGRTRDPPRGSWDATRRPTWRSSR